jgi:hypothetical protein
MRLKTQVTTADIQKLGAVECVASCLMSGLHLSGLDYRYFLLGHWNLVYYENTLMPDNDMADLGLEYAYGIETRHHSGTASDIISLLQSGGWLLLACRASRLSFFPRNLLGLESHQFLHFILVYRYGSATDTFSVIDPIANFIGEMNEAELTAAAVEEGELNYYACIPSGKEKRPSANDIFYREAADNLMKYERGDGQTGREAIRLFSQDVADSARMTQEYRTAWIERNNITLSSIVKARARVWQCFRELDLLTEDETAQGDAYLDEIAKGWTAVNFALVKLKRSPQNGELTASIQRMLERNATLELECLRFIYGKGREGVAL